jgi:hypothetical protein
MESSVTFPKKRTWVSWASPSGPLPLQSTETDWAFSFVAEQVADWPVGHPALGNCTEARSVWGIMPRSRAIRLSQYPMAKISATMIRYLYW